MIQFDDEDGLSLNARVVCAMAVGFVTHIGQRTYTIRWLDGEMTTQLRPDISEPEEFAQAAE